jgi:hypothetical protein
MTPRMTAEDLQEFQKILRAHHRTIEVCRACAETTRDLAAEVKRGGVPARQHLAETITAAEDVLNDLRGVEAEVQRLLSVLGEA